MHIPTQCVQVSVTYLNDNSLSEVMPDIGLSIGDDAIGVIVVNATNTFRAGTYQIEFLQVRLLRC